MNEKQESAPKSPFTPDESSFRLYLATACKETSGKVASHAELQIEIDNLKQQLEIAKENSEQQRREADACKKQLEDTELKLKNGIAHVCQRITSHNTQCTKAAHQAIKYNGLLFWVCKQHLKQYPDAEPEMKAS